MKRCALNEPIRAFCSVYLNYHTVEQVYCGASIGVVFGVVWRVFVAEIVQPYQLYYQTTFFVIVLRYDLHWAHEMLFFVFCFLIGFRNAQAE